MTDSDRTRGLTDDENSIKHITVASDKHVDLAKRYYKLEPMQTNIKAWSIQLEKQNTRSPVVMPGELLCFSALKMSGFSCFMALFLAAFSSYYYLWLYYNDAVLKFSPEQCGSMVQIIADMWSIVSPTLAQIDAVNSQPTPFPLLNWCIGLSSKLMILVSVTISVVYPKMVAVLPNQVVPVIVVFCSLIFDALSIGGATMAYLLYNIIYMIDPHCLMPLITFLIIGTITKRTKGQFYFKSVMGHTPVTLQERDIAVHMGTGLKKKTHRSAIQIVANGYSLVCIMFPLIVFYAVFPPQLGDSIIEHIDLLHFSNYPYLRGNSILQAGFLFGGIGKYFQGARDLILTKCLETNLKNMSLGLLKKVASRQILYGIACCAADSMASDVGQFWNNQRVISPVFPFVEVKRGTQGGISIVGVLASALGGLGVGYSYCFSSGSLSREVLLLCMVAGLVGSYIDSILGWYLQPSACDIFGTLWDDRIASLVVGLDYLKLLKSDLSPDLESLVTEIRANTQGLPLVEDPLDEKKMVPITLAMRKHFVHYSTILKPCTILLDNHSVNFIAPLLTNLAMMAFVATQDY